ncbi:MAG: hypothetical protein ABSH46_03120 [Bryobacteraceae bacterium]|jgi:WD40 repeat protein
MNRPALITCLAVLPALASSPTAWEMNNYRDFIAGRLTGLSLTRDGKLTLAPKLETVFDSGQPVIWSVAAAPDGAVYIGTGHRGRVFRIEKSGQASLIWTAEQPEVFALAVDAKGALYAATSPGGRIYRIENGKASEYFATGAKYIWSLAFAPDGALYAGTGDQGRVYRITEAGKGEVYYETGQSHVTSMAFDAQGRLLAGTEPNGIIYRITGKDKAFVLYDAALPEVRSLVPAADGTVYAAALGGSMGRRALGGVQSLQGVPGSVSVSTTTATVTVEASEAQSGIDIKPKPEAAKPQPAQAAVAGAAATVETSGVEKAAIYRINTDNTVETLWSSKEENVYDLLVHGDDIVFSTDGQGRIYRLGTDRRASLIAQTNEGEAIRLLASPNGILAATGDLGKLYRLGPGLGASGTFESPVHDSNTVARWGRLSWRGDAPDGTRLVLRTRTGNSARPDKTWSEWSAPLTNAAGSPILSPNARYVQWQAEFTGPASLEGVTLAYLPQNTPPVVRSIVVTSQLSSVTAAARAAAAQTQPTASYTLTVTDTPDAAPAPTAGTSTQPVTRPAAEQLQIAWQADDPDGDRLAYSLYFRGEDEREWKLLKSNLSENSYAIDSDSLADGRYYFRVVASDAPANPPSTARTAELVSAPTLIDHTPPVVTAGPPSRSGSHVEIEIDAVDAASPLRHAEYSVDAGPWVPMEPVEGILDSPREHFVLKLDGIAPGEHLVVVRALDSANNAGLAKVVVR